jgi:Zn finger protein HypA/HybF involved in hydrogenase expression
MHEMSIALEVCRIAEQQVGLAAKSRVREIGVVVGHNSGVEPESLRFCLDALLDQPPVRGARTAMEMTAGDDLRVAYHDLDDDGDTPN